MKFAPRNEYEEEAFAIEPPRFDIGQRMTVNSRIRPAGGVAVDGPASFEGTITDIYLRTVEWPLWKYQIDGGEWWYDAYSLAPVAPTD